MNYIPPQYYNSPQIPNGHPASPVPRQETTQRKRPKYTRSKTGCLTCRIKKIKCDETKPACVRCTHGQRDCTWPEGVPTSQSGGSRPSNSDGFDSRPSTAGSSGTSTPPTRDHTPPIGMSADLGLLPSITSRRNSEPFLYNQQGSQQTGRRGSVPHVEPASIPEYDLPESTIGDMSMIPNLPLYPRHDLGYTNNSRPLMQPHASRRGPSNLHRSGDQFMNAPQIMQQWNPPIANSLDPLEPFFQNAQERNLIHHYCDNSLSIIVAAPSENPNPIVAANLPLVLSQPRGSCMATEALRSGLMSVAAIHQSYLLARGGATPDGADAMLRIAQHHRMNSKAHLAEACKTMAGTRSDASLAASLAIALTDIFLGGRNWSKNMDLAKTLVRVRGGPSALLGISYPSTPGAIQGISRNRLFLEILAVYDVAGCIVSGQEMTLVDPDTDNWWLDDPYPTCSWVEPIFGISRSFVPLLARLITFLSRVGKQKNRTIEQDAENLDDCSDIYNALEAWTLNLSDLPARVHAGNTIYAKVSQIMLLREILKVDPIDSTVQDRAHIVLDLCSDCAASKMGVDLVWPVIVAGSHMYGDDRIKVLQIFEAFRSQCCYEIDTAEQVVRQVWKRRDQGHPQPEWRHVMKDFDMSPLLL